MSALLAPDTRAAYAAGGRQIAERFSMDDCAEKFRQIYAKLLE
jgi:hypothetical protein